MKVTLQKSIYNCKIIISLGYRNDMYISERQEMWDLWKSLRDTLYKNNDDKLGRGGNCILPSTFPLNSYRNTSTLQNWGCIGDIEAQRRFIILDENSILSPIQFDFDSFGYPPMKWCEFMRKKGFMITLYFIDNDNRRLYKNGNCGKCIYAKKRIIEDLYTMPSINYTEASAKYKKYKHMDNYECRRKLVKYRDDIYSLEGFCDGLKDLLDTYGCGPCAEGMMLYKKSKISNDLEDIEEKLTNGELNDGEYLDKCNSLKKQYDNIKFASM